MAKLKPSYFIWLGVIAIAGATYWWWTNPATAGMDVVIIAIGIIVWLYGDYEAGAL